MKVYNLSCERDHRFEGWFSSEDDFSSQLMQQFIECPLCESRSIKKLPSAPRLNLSGAKARHAVRAPSAPEASEAPESQADANIVLQAKLMEFARKVIANTEDVGDRFAEEARRIHYNETPQRGIRGVATPDQCESLADEGIDVVQIPIPAALKQPLQ